MKRPQNISRRSFLKSSAAFGAIAFLPAHIALGKSATNGHLPPSERINLAVVGIGNQGGRDRQHMIDSGLCTVVALCDIDLEGKHTLKARQAHQAAPIAQANDSTTGTGAQPQPEATVYPKARVFNDFRRMFDVMADDIDAVLIATPDHSHFAITMLAMSLGKHVFVEKPLAHTFGQCERMMELAARSGVVTQMGNQGHSGANYFQFKAWSEAGIIKDVTRITAHMNKARRWHGWGSSVTEFPREEMPSYIDWDSWISSAPLHPFSNKLHPQEWRSWFDYGSGAFGDWGPHILDTCHRFLNLGLPEKVSALKLDGANPFVYPQASTIRFDFPKRGDMPPCEVTWYDGIDNKPEVEEEYGELIEGSSKRAPIELKAPGKIIYSKDLVFKGDSHSSPLTIIPKEKYMDMRRTLPRFPQKNSDHYANFLLACKGEEESRSPFNISAPLSQVFNLGIIAQRTGSDILFDRKTKQITNNALANKLLDPAPRKGWEEFYRL